MGMEMKLNEKGILSKRVRIVVKDRHAVLRIWIEFSYDLEYFYHRGTSSEEED